MSDTKKLKKMYDKFTRQFDYAIKVLYLTFSDTIDMQLSPDSEEAHLQKELLAIAVSELLFTQSSQTQDGLTKEEKKLIDTNRQTIDEFKDEIMQSQPDIREFIIQTNRMQVYYYNLVIEDYAKTEAGKSLTKFLDKYAGDLPMVYPATYDKVCEDVAKKTDSMKLYKQLLKGKYY